MNNPAAFNEDDVIPWQSVLILIFSSVAGALLAINLLPALLPGFLASIGGEAPKAFWYLSRSSAFVAYLLLWLSMVFGLVITNRMAKLWPGGPAAFELHQHVSLLAIAFALFHGLILMGDQFINVSFANVMLPFMMGSYRPIWVGLGQVGLYLSLLVTVTFYARKWLGGQRWRVIHLMSYLGFGLALTHGLLSGTDTLTIGALLMYAISGISVFFLTTYRILSGLLKNAVKASNHGRRIHQGRLG
jgi:predicted ferric reductase